MTQWPHDLETCDPMTLRPVTPWPGDVWRNNEMIIAKHTRTHIVTEDTERQWRYHRDTVKTLKDNEDITEKDTLRTLRDNEDITETQQRHWKTMKISQRHSKDTEGQRRYHRERYIKDTERQWRYHSERYAEDTERQWRYHRERYAKDTERQWRYHSERYAVDTERQWRYRRERHPEDRQDCLLRTSWDKALSGAQHKWNTNFLMSALIW